jgi:hypothetical protein
MWRLGNFGINESICVGVVSEARLSDGSYKARLDAGGSVGLYNEEGSSIGDGPKYR